jgi:hypothetical protein
MFVFSTVTKQGVLEGDVDTLANERFKAWNILISECQLSFHTYQIWTPHKNTHHILSMFGFDSENGVTSWATNMFEPD